MYLEFAMLQGAYAHGLRERERQQGLDPYLGQGATANIWFSPHPEDPAKLQNALAERASPQEPAEHGN